MGVRNLLFQQVFFVQEENSGGFFKPLGGQDGLEQCQALLQSILREHTFGYFKVLTEPLRTK